MQDKALNVTMILGGALGLAQIESILGIVLLAVQLVLIICKTIEKVKASKSTKEKIEAIESAQEEIDSRKEKK